MKPIYKVLIALLVVWLVASACGVSAQPSVPPTPDANALRITAGSELKSVLYEADGKTLSDVGRAIEAQGITFTTTFKGGGEIRAELLALNGGVSQTTDVYIPASALSLPGNTTSYPHAMKTYVGLLVDKEPADQLGWDPAKDLPLQSLIDAVGAGTIHLAMTNPSQSNSGKSFYLAALTTLCKQEVLTSDCSQKPEVSNGANTLMKGIDKTAESTGFLADAYVRDHQGAHRYNAMVTYESLATQVESQIGGQYWFYVDGATAIADEPMVFTGDPAKKPAFDKLVAALQSPDVTKLLNKLGWRTSTTGMAQPDLPSNVFNPKYGFDTSTEFPTMTYPRAEVADQAIVSYLMVFKKPSFTIYVLDFSGSMDGNGGRVQLLDAMGLILDQNRASDPNVQLQAGPQDVTVVYVFWGDCKFVGRVDGNDQGALINLYNQIASFSTGPSTAMFSCTEQALDYVKANHSDAYQYAVIPMTDGGSNSGDSAEGFKRYYKNFVDKNGYEVPIFGIAFGNQIDANQLDAFKSKTVGGFWYNAGTELVPAFKKAKGNN